jgi:ubiquinone/menaquinone biosynthesis C-methylase UbiE
MERQATTAKEMIGETLDLEAKSVLDVGCGRGALVRLFQRRGAEATGVDPQPERVEECRDADPDGARYEVAGGEALPFDDASFDIVTFFNSLHHVPSEKMKAALHEAVRVLRPGGVLWVWEPIAEGPSHLLTQPLDDETQVRAAAKAELDKGLPGMTLVTEREVETPYLLESFDAFKEQMIAVDPAREKAFSNVEHELRERFDTLGEDTPDGRLFPQPCRLHVFRKDG